MSFFKVISYDSKNNLLLFEFNNNNAKYNINISIPNALRRIILSEIPIVGVDKKSIIFEANDSHLHNDLLSHRLELLPINNIENYDKIKCIFNKTNDTDNYINIFAKDFTFINEDTNEEVNNICSHPDILFSQLKSNKTLNFSFLLKKDIAKNEENGGGYVPVSCISYHFKHDEKKINEEIKDLKTVSEKNKFKLTYGDKIYLKRNDNPSCYIFKLEPININAKEIMKLSFDILIDKLQKFIIDLDNNEIFITLANISKVCYELKIFNEDDTLGNILQSYLYYDDEIDYVGYDIPHPLYKEIIVRISLKKDNTIENIKKIIKLNINNLIQLLILLKKDFIKNI